MQTSNSTMSRFDDWLVEYEMAMPELSRSEAAVRARLAEALETSGISLHSVGSRLKTPASLRHKLARPEKMYRSLWDVTDLLGFRIITHFEDGIEAAAQVIEDHFAVDYRNSVDRLRFQDHSRFGYRSLHYVCSLKTGAVRGAPIRFEIQVRTVLQHAWAEVEHDLGYKRGSAVPDEIRRRFARVASLLEIADEEFVALRREQDTYKEAAAVRAWDTELSPPIDSLTLPLLADSPEARELDREIARILGKPLSAEVFFPDYLVRMLKLAGVQRLAEAREALSRDRADIVGLVEPYFKFSLAAWRLSPHRGGELPRGYALFFLAHVAVLQNSRFALEKLRRLTDFYRELDYPDDLGTAQAVASSLFEELHRAGHGQVSAI